MSKRTTRHGLWLGFVVVFFSSITAFGATPALMELPGKADVSPSGSASYSIPIQVPPGTAGMVPSLSLQYSSQNGNGMAGIGWSLSGLSTITRCPQTVATEGGTLGVTYTASDRFCLDGQKLIAISGTYGADQTEYRTEVDSFSKIVSYGSNTGGGPVKFRVWTKSGLVMDFGGPSVYLTPTGVARSWSVFKIADAKTNQLWVSYYQNGTCTNAGSVATASPVPAAISQGVGEIEPCRIGHTLRSANDFPSWQ